MLDRAREEIRREREAAVEEVRREFAGIAILAADELLSSRSTRIRTESLLTESWKKVSMLATTDRTTRQD